jgi:hypothetical protein
MHAAIQVFDYIMQSLSAYRSMHMRMRQLAAEGVLDVEVRSAQRYGTLTLTLALTRTRTRTRTLTLHGWVRSSPATSHACDTENRLLCTLSALAHAADLGGARDINAHVASSHKYAVSRVHGTVLDVAVFALEPPSNLVFACLSY